ncbi:MAG: polysaccharide biosynthesis protein [Phycisphaerales bacterium]|nr:polysaccharide biosynthesis protein [Phycisphaerales bacterium]
MSTLRWLAPRSAAQKLPENRPLPARAVLIGTPQTISQARQQLELLEDGPQAVGCVLVAMAPGPVPAGPAHTALESGATQSGATQSGAARRAGGGLPVLGTLEMLSGAALQNDIAVAVVSLPSAMTDAIQAVRAAVRKAGLAERFLPPLSELLTQAPPYSVGLASPAGQGVGGIGPARVDIAELIGRAPHTLDRNAVGRILSGKRVLITGAGGSIGSELARLAADFAPSHLHLMERSENALFEIDRQIARRTPGVTRRALLHDVVDADQTLRLLVELRPQVVFHAAAHKHVPLMEDHPSHAVNNNLFGTKSIADAAVAVGAERFILISTDKAVNPTSVMGSTKRLAELYVQWLHESSRRMTGGAGTSCGMVRFGNVIGSACSVLTIWSAQLAEGGPVTVTDPRMTRFFMTIPEAATLVLQAAAMPGPGDGAAVHVLDMGGALPIVDLACRFVRAHGFEPRLPGVAPDQTRRAATPIDIAFTGVRPGEKLHEELSYAAESLRPTAHPGIRAWAGAPATFNCAAMIADLSGVRASPDRAAVLAAIRRHLA